MSDTLIPADAKRAASRGFIRTASQSLATGFAVPGGLTLAFTGNAMLALALGLAGLAFSAVINGLQSYFSILAKGIPEDYAPVIRDQVVTDVNTGDVDLLSEEEYRDYLDGLATDADAHRDAEQ